MNAIDLEILWSRLIAIADEAGATLKRTSFSTVVRESNDFACVLLDAQARLVAQSTLSIPGFIGTAPLSLAAMLRAHPAETLAPGDILFTNDPWIGSGHLNDATMAAPVFMEGRLVAWVMAVAHLSDIGGRQWSADANEVFEEGICFPVLKLAEGGRFNPLVMQMLQANVRLPRQVQGDIEAQIGALGVAERRLLEMLGEYGLTGLDELAQAIFDASREAALKGLRRIPPGVYHGRVDSDGFDERVSIRATVTVGHDGVTVDYAGSTPQVRFGINESFNHTYAYTIYPFKCLLSPDIPNNDGFTRLFTVIAPEGTIVNARRPAAVGARHLIGHQLQAAIFDALSSALPGQVQADSGTPLWSVLLRGVDAAAGTSFSSILFFNGGMGAGQGRDGSPASGFPANISNTPIEVAETLAPVLFHRKQLAEGSGGDGAQRGGMGQVVEFESRWSGRMRVSLLTDRTREPARGILGGHSGRVGHVHLNGQPVAHPKSVIEMQPGDRLELALPGGGGYGPPP
ncbi:MAG: hydantoinase B/oxoprolinase family protein [Rubrivivax sp.]|nr:hydantoinase B/oxoprolinase family protein [Rubrivivax sp.]